MFKILQKTVRTGIVTTDYPASEAHVPGHFRGKPSFDFERWQDARPAAEVCPTEAISFRDDGDTRIVTVDYGRCIFCGLCAGEAARITQEFELATRSRNRLVRTVTYGLNPDGTHSRFSGGIFGESYTSLGGVDNVVPVDVYIPGCPPRPQALLHGILVAIGRLREKLQS
jgi:ferredoxin